ncbi:MAG: FAD:protein transferase [Anaerophaga sp.]|nr:FAD:protein transferase [Anaerophaga sp.]
MNTVLDIVFPGSEKECAETAASAIIAKIKKLQEVLDRYDSNAETYRINKTASQGTVPASPLLIHFIRQGINYFNLTDGYFNIFGGKIYSWLKENNRVNTLHPPSFSHPKEIIQINEKHHTVHFLTDDISLDFGGMGKGIALDAAANIIEKHGIFNAFISFGGSSVLTRGRHPHGDFWPFALKSGDKEGEIWKLTNSAVSVSEAKTGQNKHPHIWNIKEEKPVSSGRISCVQAQSAADAEVLSTALIAAPAGKQKSIIQNFKVVQWRVFNTTHEESS